MILGFDFIIEVGVRLRIDTEFLWDGPVVRSNEVETGNLGRSPCCRDASTRRVRCPATSVGNLAALGNGPPGMARGEAPLVRGFREPLAGWLADSPGLG